MKSTHQAVPGLAVSSCGLRLQADHMGPVGGCIPVIPGGISPWIHKDHMNAERDPRNPDSGGLLLCPEAVVLMVGDTNFVVKHVLLNRSFCLLLGFLSDKLGSCHLPGNGIKCNGQGAPLHSAACTSTIEYEMHNLKTGSMF